MTQEDKELLLKDLCSRLPYYDSTMAYKSFNFLNSHHFDYRVVVIEKRNNKEKYDWSGLFHYIGVLLRSLFKL